MPFLIKSIIQLTYSNKQNRNSFRSMLRNLWKYVIFIRHRLQFSTNGNNLRDLQFTIRFSFLVFFPQIRIHHLSAFISSLLLFEKFQITKKKNFDFLKMLAHKILMRFDTSFSSVSSSIYTDKGRLISVFRFFVNAPSVLLLGRRWWRENKHFHPFKNTRE